MTWWEQLDKSSGSRPRAVLMMSDESQVVADRLTNLVDRDGVVIKPSHNWMPKGKPVQEEDSSWDTSPAKEAMLSSPNELVEEMTRKELRTWWLKVARGANVPNWDIASECLVDGVPGLLLVEAKAHGGELDEKPTGKKPPTTLNGWKNHQKIGRAIADASAELQFATSSPWAISRDKCYQLSNRFAWSWKLASLGIPVVLVYLGFLDATEMPEPHFQVDGVNKNCWRTTVLDYCSGLVPPEVWDDEYKIDIDDVSLIPLIRTYDQAFDPNAEENP